MHVEHRRDNLIEDPTGLLLAKLLPLLQNVEEFPAWAQFGDDMEVVGLLVYFVDFQDVGVVHLF